MIFAGVSSLQNMFEAVAESLLHRFPKLRRTVALGIICVICLGAGIGMEAITRWGIWMDLVSIYIIPIGATLGAISWFWIMKKNDLFAAINEGGRKPRGKLWYFLGQIPVRANFNYSVRDCTRNESGVLGESGRHNFCINPYCIKNG